MKRTITTYLQSQVVEEELELTLLELCHACDVHQELITIWVEEGLLEPNGEHPEDWRFGGAALKRSKLALRLSRDLEINPAGVALVLDLLDEIEQLKAQLKRRSA